MDRRAFIGLVGAGLVTRAGGVPTLDFGSPSVAGSSRGPRPRTALPRIREVSGADLTLTAGPTTAPLRGSSTEVWSYNDAWPAPMIRLTRGERARIRLVNRLDEETIVHWHGLDVPEAADGHPRLAIDPGAEYAYDFAVTDAPGLYWYHPHTHGRTASQTYMGMAGLLVIEDEAEADLGLPSGEFELALVLQDRRLGSAAEIRYAPTMGPDRMYGYLGDTGFVNGAADASVEVGRGVYRLRVLNGSNARILELAFGDDMPFTLIGADGGFLPEGVTLRRLTLGTGERADLLVDFSAMNPGDSIMLHSAEFEVPGMMMGMGGMGGRMGRGRGMGMGGGAIPQGGALDLMEFVVTGDSGPDVSFSGPIAGAPDPAVDPGTVDRTFRFDSRMMQHTINGRSFAMDRIDERIPAGSSEVWEFVNDGAFAHPVHVHGGQHRVLSREGGRGEVMPWERGLKDTALLLPGERIRMAVEFTHPGIFLLHCHNLEHEDAGMMSNFEVLP
jgi:FtsP/CotA-like multicopper oxidase with cupredoxin domain